MGWQQPRHCQRGVCLCPATTRHGGNCPVCPMEGVQYKYNNHIRTEELVLFLLAYISYHTSNIIDFFQKGNVMFKILMALLGKVSTISNTSVSYLRISQSKDYKQFHGILTKFINTIFYKFPLWYKVEDRYRKFHLEIRE